MHTSTHEDVECTLLPMRKPRMHAHCYYIVRYPYPHLDMGVNSSAYSFATWTLPSKDADYIYGTDTTIIGSSGSAFEIFSGGTLASNVRMIFGNTGSIYHTGLSTGVMHLSSTGLESSSTIASGDLANSLALPGSPTVSGTASTSTGGIVTIDGTQTITNKRITARVSSQTTVSATPSFNTDNYDIFKVTAQAVDITNISTNLSGTPVDGDIVEFEITGTAARALTFGTSFVSSTVTIPTTTVTTATLTIVFQYFTNSSYGNNKWVCVNSF